MTTSHLDAIALGYGSWYNLSYVLRSALDDQGILI